MRADEFKATLRERRLLLDGAMGTEVIRLNLGVINPGEACVAYPAVVTSIHTRYIEAGADIITTNTFIANPLVCREGAKLARCVADKSGKKVYVAGSIGPVKDVSFNEAIDLYTLRIKALIEGGVDLLMFETVLDTPTLCAGLEAVKTVDKDIPVAVSATPAKEYGTLLSGEPLSAFVTAVEGYDNVVCIGLNCGFGPAEMVPYMQRLRGLSTLPLCVHPNAGVPVSTTPSEFADACMQMLEDERIRIIGGCCGTTPDHISAVRQRLHL